jgi:hypothetical protein
MQIHEITKAPLQEGFFDSMIGPAATAARAAKKLQKQGYGQEKPLPTVQDAIKAVQQNPAQQQYIKGLVAQWPQVAPKPVPTVATTPDTIKPVVTPLKSRQPSLTVNGQLLTRGEDNQWRDEAGELITNPKDVQELERRLKAQATMAAQNKQMTSASGIKEAFRSPEQTAALKKQRAQGKGSTGSGTANNSYQDAFEKWAAGKLRTVDPYTRQTITLDQLKQTDIKDELDRALAQVVATADNPQGNAVAVNNYLTIAVSGVARESQRLKSKTPDDAVGRAPTSLAGQAIVTQQDIRNSLAQAGVNQNQLEQLKKLAQDPASRQALLKSFGVAT